MLRDVSISKIEYSSDDTDEGIVVATVTYEDGVIRSYSANLALLEIEARLRQMMEKYPEAA